MKKREGWSFTQHIELSYGTPFHRIVWMPEVFINCKDNVTASESS